MSEQIEAANNIIDVTPYPEPGTPTSAADPSISPAGSTELEELNDLAPVRATEKTDLSSTLVPGEDADIPEEDRREILSQIDQVLNESRMKATDEVFVIRAQKQGVVFPMLVNVFLLLVLTGGIYAFARLFEAGDLSLAAETGVLTGTEGRLLEALKKEAEEQLEAKANEISQIQDQLSNIAREREDLEANLNQRVLDRERELRLAIDQELAAERQRLQGQGVSETDIQARLGTLEAEKTQEFNARIADFRAEAESEKREIEANLEALQTEYADSLNQLSLEREELIAESQAQLEARTQELEQQRTVIEEQLNELSEQREREVLVNSQLIGLYDSVKESMRGLQFGTALETLDTIRGYLNQDGIADLPSVLERRDVEFFLIDSLATLAEEQRGRSEVDVTSVVAQANLITQIRDVVLRADQAVAQGDTETAERLYSEALGIMPEVARGTAFLTEQETKLESERQARLDGLLALADSSFGQGSYGQAVGYYRDALAYLPEPQAEIQRLVDQLTTSGSRLGVETDRQSQTTASAEPLRQADTLLSEGRLSQAIVAYVDVLSRYPRSDNTRRAIDGIQLAVARGASGYEDQTSELAVTLESRLAEIRSLEETVDERDAEITALNTQIVTLETQIGELDQELVTLKEETIPALENQITSGTGSSTQLQEQVQTLESEKSSLQATLDARLAELANLRQSAAQLTSANQELTETVTELQSENQQLRDGTGETAIQPESATSSQVLTAEMARLVEFETRYKGLVNAYGQYSAAEDRVLSGGGSEGLVESKLFLDDFLTSPAVQESFPSLWDRIKRYDRAFEDVGRQAALQDLSDLIYDLRFYATRDEKIRFLDQQIDDNQDSPVLADLLTELKDMVQP